MLAAFLMCAQGSAPVANACGLAGGTPWGPNVAEAGDYVNTTYAHHGMAGTDLPAMDTGVVWKAGGTAEVTWQIRNNHGGGYQVCAHDSHHMMLIWVDAVPSLPYWGGPHRSLFSEDSAGVRTRPASHRVPERFSVPSHWYLPQRRHDASWLHVVNDAHATHMAWTTLPSWTQ